MNKKLAVLVYKYQSGVWKGKEQINCKSITHCVHINSLNIFTGETEVAGVSC